MHTRWRLSWLTSCIHEPMEFRAENYIATSHWSSMVHVYYHARLSQIGSRWETSEPRKMILVRHLLWCFVVNEAVRTAYGRRLQVKSSLIWTIHACCGSKRKTKGKIGIFSITPAKDEHLNSGIFTFLAPRFAGKFNLFLYLFSSNYSWKFKT